MTPLLADQMPTILNRQTLQIKGLLDDSKTNHVALFASFTCIPHGESFAGYFTISSQDRKIPLDSVKPNHQFRLVAASGPRPLSRINCRAFMILGPKTGCCR